MSEQINFEPTSENTVKLLRIILGALILGVVVSAVFIVPGQLKNKPGVPGTMNWILISIATGGLIASFIIPQVITRGALKSLKQQDPSTVENGLLNAFITGRIARGALLEGPAFLNIVLIDPHRPYLHLGIVAILLAGIAISIPSLSSLNEWMRFHKELMELEPGSNS